MSAKTKKGHVSPIPAAGSHDRTPISSQKPKRKKKTSRGK